MSGCCPSSSPQKPSAGSGCRCGGNPRPPPWQDGDVASPAGPVPRVRTQLDFADTFGAVRVRCNFGRMNYRIAPGLYAVGTPDADAPVLVTASYKLTFDRLRQELGGLNLWLLVLDTDGINVWCAAGKGTFGTAELVHRIAAVRLPEVVRHRGLILPQLGAPGVAAHEVRKRSGFRVTYGPVLACDLPAFLASNLVATPEMRRVRFPLAERLAVVPVELTLWFKYAALLILTLVLAAGFLGGAWSRAGGVSLLTVAAYLTGGVLAPVLLPWLPGRAFALKGAWLGLGLAAALQVSGGFAGMCGVRNGWEAAGWWLLLPAITSFMALNYTGTSTFTSQSGVKRELRVAIPLQATGVAAGLALFIAAQFKGG